MRDRILADYLRDGYAIVESVLTEAECSEAIRAIEHIQDNTQTLSPELSSKLLFERDLPASRRGGVNSESAGNALFIILDPPAFHPFFASLILNSAVVDFTRKLLQTNDIVYHFSNVTMKRERIGSGINFHRDFPNKYICPQASSFLRVMLCLDGMTKENGATQFIKGSHLISDEEARTSRINTSAAAEQSLAQADADVAECPRGSVVFIHPKSIHGGLPNSSTHHRRNVIVQWGRADDPISVEPDLNESLAGFGVEELENWLALRASS